MNILLTFIGAIFLLWGISQVSFESRIGQWTLAVLVLVAGVLGFIAFGYSIYFNWIK